jgi:large repetitive protein
MQLLLLLTALGLSAQESITADHSSGCDTLRVTFSLDNAQPLENYSSVSWNFGDGNSAAGTLSPVHTYIEPGLYDVRCVLDGSRVLEELEYIEVGETPYAGFVFTDLSGSDAAYLYRFETAWYTPSGGMDTDYTWRFPGGTEQYDSTAEFLFEDEGIYEVFLLLENPAGCADSIVKKVPVSKQLMVPNVFSPNGDEVNDYFEVTTPGDYIYTFRVFTRDGLLIYASVSPLIRWDGRLGRWSRGSRGRLLLHHPKR